MLIDILQCVDIRPLLGCTCSLMLVLSFLWRINLSQYANKCLARARQTTVQPFLATSRVWQAYRFCFLGPTLIDEGYFKAQGKPYVLDTPDCKIWFVSSEEHVKQVDGAGHDELSLHAAAKQMFKPEYTMHGFNWHDKRGVEGVGFVRALRILLSQQLPSIVPDLRKVIEREFIRAFSIYGTGGNPADVQAYPVMKHVISMCNAYVFFGKDMILDDKFMKAAVNYIEQVIKAAEIIRLCPSWLAPIVGKYYRNTYNSQDKLFAVLTTIVEQRVKAKARGVSERPNDCVQWIIDTSPKENPWTVERIVHEVMAVWFGSVHATSITAAYSVFDLCLHPEYIPAMRAELGDSDPNRICEPDSLPLMDSFIKESTRLSPAEALSTRRKALKQFVFTDGTTVEKGDWTCIPLGAMLRDEQTYPSADTFNAFRFVTREQLPTDAEWQKKPMQTVPSAYTDTKQWQVWGSGRKLCAGRFYVTSLFKLITEHVLEAYDVELVDVNAPRFSFWRSTILPRADAKVRFRRRIC